MIGNEKCSVCGKKAEWILFCYYCGKCSKHCECRKSSFNER